MSKEGMPHNNTDYEVINQASIQHGQNIKGPKSKISEKPKLKHEGTETHDLELEQEQRIRIWDCLEIKM